MNAAIFSNEKLFMSFQNCGLRFLLKIKFNNINTIPSVFEDDVIVFNNYFENEMTYDYVENYVINNSLYITYLPRQLNCVSYAFVTKSEHVHEKISNYLKLYKKNILAIYDFASYIDSQWKQTIMCERMCAKMMNDVCKGLYNTTVMPRDFISSPHSLLEENKSYIQSYIDFSDKIITGEGTTRLLKEMGIYVNAERLILHPHVWGTDSTYSSSEIENMYGYNIPLKNMCYMSNVQSRLKTENSFIGFYINEYKMTPKIHEIILWGKDIDFVMGKGNISEKINLLDKLCEKYSVYVTVDTTQLKKIDDLKLKLKNSHNFHNYGILDRSRYLEELKKFKIFLSINEYVEESMSYLEALAVGCHVISIKNFHSAVVNSRDVTIKSSYSIYDNINNIESIVEDVIKTNQYKPITLNVFKKFNYINRVINVCNGLHETRESVYL